MTQLPQSLVPGNTGCNFSDPDLVCKDKSDFKTSLANELGEIWRPIVTIFRVIAVLFFIKQIFSIYKNIVAQKHVDAAKSFGYLVLGTFLMFDIGNTIYLAFNFKDFVQDLIDRVSDIIKSEKPKPPATPAG